MNGLGGDLAFLPLGGTGEIGMNLNLYRCNGYWLAVDCGIGFGGAANPEVELMTPDPAFIAERRDRLVGLVITHAHEDHIGAVAWLWPRLRCPVYATPFAIAVLRRKLRGRGRVDVNYVLERHAWLSREVAGVDLADASGAEECDVSHAVSL